MGCISRRLSAKQLICLSFVFAAGCGFEPGATEPEAESVGETAQALVTTITTLAQLRAMSPTGDYVLGADIDASATAATPFVGIGTLASPFRGSFDGKTFKITNLTVSATGWYTGMFKIVEGATLKNIRLVNVNVPGSSPYTGAIAGVMNDTTLSDSTVSGTVKGAESTGGLVGSTANSTLISNSISNLNVTGTSKLGGFVGFASWSSFVTNCTSTNGSVKGTVNTGGFVGEASDSHV
ncbi:MAG TPA: ZmpA/ZmpB/ZmpC family metallo-endopeptidase-related protein, partial [Polyangiaceae bacterium]|nr:ZmpA/ZmpB/ZmpC family metallo-endopeptidase-related protein [Polyangiaceae bacterium]